MILVYILLGLVWYACGVWGFVWWFTKEFDVTIAELPIALFAGVVGPMAWLIGLSIHGDGCRVIFKRKNR